MIIEWIGYAAAFLTTVCYVPQALHIIVTRRTAGISLLSYSLMFIGCAFWLIYGLCVKSWPVVAANGVTLPLVGAILVMKWRLGRR